MSNLPGSLQPRVAWVFALAVSVSGFSIPAPGYASDADSDPATSTADAAQRIHALRDTDPAAAIRMAESLFKSALGATRLAVGSELVESYIKAKRIEDAKSLVANLESGSTLDNEGRATLLRVQLMVATAVHIDSETDLLAEQVQAVSTAVANRLVRAELLAQLGQARLVQSRFADSAATFEQALEAVGENDSQLRFEILQKVGVAYAQLGRYPDAIQSFSAAEKVNARLGRRDDATFLLRFGGVFLYTGDSTRAISYLNRALAVSETNPGQAVNRSSIYNNLGTAYYGLKNFEQAAVYFRKAMDYARDNGGNRASPMNNLANVLREWGRDREALDLFKEYEQISTSAGDKEGIGVAAKNIGETYIKLGERKAAIIPLERAYAIYSETDYRPKRLELYPVMIENLEALGRTADALRLMREFKALSDETINVESRERISKLETAIDLAEKQKQLKASERDRTQQAAAISDLETQQGFERNINRGMLLAIAALAILIVLQVRDRWLKARAHRELTAKSEQIEEQSRALVALNEVVRRQSQEDVLTGLKNRRFLAEWMAASNQRRAADDDNKHGLEPTLLILIDIDHFKDVNDRYGHATGDQALVEFAGILRDCKRDSDLIVRWGGEEFVWLCPDTSIRSAPMLCERVRTALRARPMMVNDDQVALTASMGFAPHPLWPGQSSDWQLSMRIADHALYQCKADGRDRWLGYTPGTVPAAEAIRVGDVVALVANGNLVKVAAMAA
ncbi:MAG: diguanylate cyclase [Dokdonella sp.]